MSDSPATGDPNPAATAAGKPRPNRAVRPHAVIRVLGAGGRRVERIVKRTLWHRRLRGMIQDLPTSLQPAADWVVTGRATDEERRIVARVERIRAALAATEGVMSSYYSPMPGTFRVGRTGRAAPGPKLRQSARAHARTGSRPRKGVLLRRIAAATHAARILELGTNTGLSASYLVSSPSCQALITVEGSPELSEIARRNISSFSDRFEVRCQLFDHALEELAGAEPFDLAFIDGQHEGQATLHYSARVVPLVSPDGGIVIYDDIYWSHDMHDAWRTIVDSGTFALTVDLGMVGLGVLGPGDHRHVDLARCLGRPHIPRRLGDPT